MENNRGQDIQNQAQANEQLGTSESMKWHKFLIFFSLWLGALLSIFNGAQLFTGMHYGSAGDARMVYLYFDGLKAIDIAMGAVAVGIAVYAIMTRFALAKYQAKGPRMLTTLYVLNLAHSLIYPLLVSVVCGMEMSEVFDSSTAGSLAGSVAMIFANKNYYAKRAHLFIN